MIGLTLSGEAVKEVTATGGSPPGRSYQGLLPTGKLLMYKPSAELTTLQEEDRPQQAMTPLSVSDTLSPTVTATPTATVTAQLPSPTTTLTPTPTVTSTATVVPTITSRDTSTPSPTVEPTKALRMSGAPRTLSNRVGTGAAAFYDPSYDRGEWVRIYHVHARNPKFVAKGSRGPSPEGYHCVHADVDMVGTRFLLRANGVEIVCVTADMVYGNPDPQKDHKANWRKKWAIELSWRAFVALRLNQRNYVEVYRLE